MRKLETASRSEGIGRSPPKNFPKAARTVFRTSDTNKRKPMLSTIPKEKKRSRNSPTIPEVSSGLTSQIKFKADRSSAKTPDAPDRRLSRPTMAPISPAAGFSLLASID